MVEAFAEETDGRVTTMAGVFELNAKHAIEKIRYAEELGIDLVQLAPPHYEKPTDIEVHKFYQMVNDAIEDIGIIVYHTYWSLPESYEITLPLMTKLTDLERVVGIKWASTSLKNFTDVVFNLSDKVSIIDNQGWVDLVRNDYGIRAFMCFIGNYAPNKLARLSRLFLDGQYEQWAEEKGKALAHRFAIIKEILSLVHGTAGKGEVYTLAEGTLSKTTMELVGRPAGPPFPPQYELTVEQKADLKAKLEAEGLLSGLD
jgi:dihydrodipicolinate synthase/N-acetylneuraminate lyase